MALDLSALEAEAAALETAAKSIALSEDERKLADALARIAKAREDKAQTEKARREILRVEREQAARRRFPAGVLVKGIDLFDFFPADAQPSADLMPGGGVIVVRSPEPSRYDAAAAELEHKRRSIASVLADLLIDSTVDPDVDDKAAGAVLRAFCENFKGAATLAGDEVYKLGGARARADKRGSA